MGAEFLCCDKCKEFCPFYKGQFHRDKIVLCHSPLEVGKITKCHIQKKKNPKVSHTISIENVLKANGKDHIELIES